MIVLFFFSHLSLNRLLVGTNDGLTLVRLILALVHIIFMHPENTEELKEMDRERASVQTNKKAINQTNIHTY